MIYTENRTFFKRIYEDVYCNTYYNSCYIFLCGGAGKNNIRNSVRNLLEKQYLHSIYTYQILYPEDLFMDMLNRNKKSNLFDFENLLAQNSDIVCVICESMGSAVELGAFTQNEDVRKKMVVALENKYCRNKSFITLGPVKYLKLQNKDSIIYYKKDNLDDLCNLLIHAVTKITRKEKRNSETLLLNTLSSYITYIPIVVYFFQIISKIDLHKGIKEMLSKNKSMPSKYNDLFNASIKYLLKKRIILEEYSIIHKKEVYKLSAKGTNETMKLLNGDIKKGAIKLYDKIRCDIMKEQLNN